MIYKRLIQLVIGLILFSVGIVFTINANLGLAPWDAFHIGLSTLTGLSFGQISIIVGLILLVITYQLNESIGLGTITNIVLIGIFIDIIFHFQWIPLSENILSGVSMILLGMILIAIGSFFYIGSCFGTGPRDGLMVALTRVTRKPVGIIRASIELTVLILGALLGAKIGIGTLLIAFGIGPIVQVTFKLLKFDVHNIEHSSFLQKKKTQTS